MRGSYCLGRPDNKGERPGNGIMNTIIMLVEIEVKFEVHSQAVSRKFVVRLVEGQSPSTQIQDYKFFSETSNDPHNRSIKKHRQFYQAKKKQNET